LASPTIRHFATNHFIYLYHTVPASGSTAAFNEISRFTLNGNVAQAGSEVDILKLNDLSDATNHNGGSMHFGKDACSTSASVSNANPSNSQTLSTLLGKVLRIDVSQIQSGDPINDVTKLVPSDNPFIGTAKGIQRRHLRPRLPQSIHFRRPTRTGTIFIDDVGENTWEENRPARPGGNYGWHHAEGFARPFPHRPGPRHISGPDPGLQPRRRPSRRRQRDRRGRVLQSVE